MALDADALLIPVAGDNRAGEDLSYDDDRVRIEAAFDTSVSNTEENDDSVDWREIISLIEQQSLRTKDIWLPVFLCRAGGRAGRIETIVTGATFLGGLLEEYWPDAHPLLEDLGFQGRKGPCESLTRIGEFLAPLRRTVLVAHPRLGSFNGDDFIRFAENGAAEDGYGMFRAALADVGEAPLLEAIAQLDAIRDGIRRGDAVLTANAEGDTATNFKPTYDALAAIRRAVAAFSSQPEAEIAADEAVLAPAARSGGSAGGAIETREDVLRAIDAIAEYYRRREPGSPVPVALARVRNWVSADFLTILQDIAPGGLEEVKTVLVANRPTSDDY